MLSQHIKNGLSPYPSKGGNNAPYPGNRASAGSKLFPKLIGFMKNFKHSLQKVEFVSDDLISYFVHMFVV